MASKQKDPSELAALRRLLCGYKKRCRKKNHEFELTEIEFLKLIKQECYYCGRPPVSLSFRKVKSQPGKIFYNSIDRLRKDLGYVKNNIVTACNTCNQMKSNMQVDEFLTQIYRIYMHIIKR